MSENLTTLRGDRLDLGYLDGDTLQVQETTTAQPGQIVVTLTADRAYRLARYTGTEQVVGLVTHMYRRILEVVS